MHPTNGFQPQSYEIRAYTSADSTQVRSPSGDRRPHEGDHIHRSFRTSPRASYDPTNDTTAQARAICTQSTTAGLTASRSSPELRGPTGCGGRLRPRCPTSSAPRRDRGCCSRTLAERAQQRSTARSYSQLPRPTTVNRHPLVSAPPLVQRWQHAPPGKTTTRFQRTRPGTRDETLGRAVHRRRLRVQRSIFEHRPLSEHRKSVPRRLEPGFCKRRSRAPRRTFTSRWKGGCLKRSLFCELKLHTTHGTRLWQEPQECP